MHYTQQIACVVGTLVFAALHGNAQETALDRYIAKPDPAYDWQHYHSAYEWGVSTHFITMQSQTWRAPNEVDRTLWEHDMMIGIPQGSIAQLGTTAILFIDGGSNRNTHPEEPEPILNVATLIAGMPIVRVTQIPNQPLYFADEPQNRRVEDEILAYSLRKFLDTGDEEWPVHVAMTKAAVRAMDTAQAFMSAQGWNIEDFIVVGGSKRGWATWLVGAVDPRVKAMVPASIDVLQLNAQMKHHWESYGFYAPAVHDYADLEVFCRGTGRAGEALRRIIDPYEYRDRYTMPKLLLNSAGDQFFMPEGSRFYYQDLPEPKLLRYSFNTDHSQFDAGVILGAVSYVRSIQLNTPQPQYRWAHIPEWGAIIVKAETPVRRAILWHATNPNARDFRLEEIGAAWQWKRLFTIGQGYYIGFMPEPPQGWTAFSIDLTFDGPTPGTYQNYTTDVQIVPDILPFEGTHCSDIQTR